MSLLVVRITPGEEVIESAKHQLAKAGVVDGAIVSVVGAVDSCAISNMKRTDATVDILTEYHQPCEFSGSGEIVDGTPHIHCVLGVEGNVALSGHLHWANVETFFVNLYIENLTELT